MLYYKRTLAPAVGFLRHCSPSKVVRRCFLIISTDLDTHQPIDNYLLMPISCAVVEAKNDLV